MSDFEVLITNDDGVAAEGLHGLTRAVSATGLQAAVIAPSENRSGAGRFASYSRPTILESLEAAGGIPHYSCSGTPVDCVRVGMLGEVAPDTRLVLSGINHGPNLGDDVLNSGTVGAACEGALLGGTGLAVSQQHFDGHFHILDAHDQTTPVFEVTAEVGAALTQAILDSSPPERALLNVNVPANITDPKMEMTRLGRRFYKKHSAITNGPAEATEYLTFGRRDGPPPEFEGEPGTDFGALQAGRVSVTPVSFAWHDRDQRQAIREWAEEVCEAASKILW